LLTSEALFLVQNAPNVFWRPGSARTRWTTGVAYSLRPHQWSAEGMAIKEGIETIEKKGKKEVGAYGRNFR